ncbi:MAG: hypothetical protein ACLFSA_09020, partial [Spirochaetaceae bacterium]
MAFDNELDENPQEMQDKEKELEQYGVWVKVGPEEFSPEEDGDSKQSEYALEDLPQEEDFSLKEALEEDTDTETSDFSENGLTEEEESLLGELEEDTAQGPESQEDNAVLFEESSEDDFDDLDDLNLDFPEPEEEMEIVEEDE